MKKIRQIMFIIGLLGLIVFTFSSIYYLVMERGVAMMECLPLAAASGTLILFSILKDAEWIIVTIVLIIIATLMFFY